MSAAAKVLPQVSEGEWSLIVELLEREASGLPVEIRHTHSHAFKNELRDRLMLIEELLKRVRAA